MKILNLTTVNKPWAILKRAHGKIMRDDHGPGYVVTEEPYAQKVSRETRLLERQIERQMITADLTHGDRVYYMEVLHPNGSKVDGLRILHLSDLHLKMKPKQKVETATRFLHQQSFDIVVVSGDILHESGDELTKEQQDFLMAPDAKLGKFYVYGDHERKGEQSLRKFDAVMRKCGYEKIVNNNVSVKYNGQTIRVVGFDDIRRGIIDQKKATDGIRENEFNIGLMHNLDILDARVPRYFDLALWGHLHAGELNMVVLDGFSFMKADGAYFDLNGHRPTKRGLHFLTERTLSYGNPGFYSYFRDKGLRRVNTRRQGMAIITVRGL